MGLAVLANKSARAHQHRAVKQLHTVPFRQSCGQIHLMLSGKIEPGLHARTLGNQLGMQESFLASAEQIPGVGQLRQHNKICPVHGRLAGQFKAVFQIGLAMLNAHLRIELHNRNAHCTDRFVHG